MASSSDRLPRTSLLPEIPAPGALTIPYTTPIPTFIIPRKSATASAGLTTSSIMSNSIAASSISTASPSPTSAPGLSSGIKAAAIALPIIFVILLVPLVYLIVRSHQIRKASEQRSSQRHSQQAMIEQPYARTPSNGSPEAAFQSLDGTLSRPRSQQPRKAVNSLGLFNFGFSPLNSPTESKPMTPTVPRSFSLGRLSSNVGNGSRDIERGTGRRSKAGIPLEPPTAKTSPPSPFNPHFAPLDQIGIAHTRDGRSRPARSATRKSEDVRDAYASLRLSNVNRMSEDPQPSLEEAQGATAGPRDRLADANDQVRGINRQPSAISHAQRTSHLSAPNRYSDVSAMSEEDENGRSSNSFSGLDDSDGTQPYRIL